LHRRRRAGRMSPSFTFLILFLSFVWIWMK
jgi:hypothetical protein